MTAPVTTEALRTALVHACFDPGHVIGPRDGRTMDEWRGDACMKQLAPFLAAHQQVTAERDEARAENDRFRAGLANGSGPCVYCDLSSEDWSKCRSGFPGCGRADDAMLCPHFGAEMEANDRADTAEAELARLRAEGEDLRADLHALLGAAMVFADMDAMDPPEGVPLNEWLPAITGTRAVVRTALARAATAREG